MARFTVGAKYYSGGNSPSIYLRNNYINANLEWYFSSEVQVDSLIKALQEAREHVYGTQGDRIWEVQE